jgi:hypothetical protein
VALHCTYLYIILVICLRQHIKWWVIPDTCTSVILDILQEHRYFSGESVADTLEDLQLLRPSKASHIGKHAFEPLGFWTPELSWFDTRLTRLNSDVLPETGIEPSQTGLAFIFRCINMLKFHLWFKAWWHPFLDQLWWFNHPKNLLVRDHNPVFYGNKQTNMKPPIRSVDRKSPPRQICQPIWVQGFQVCARSNTNRSPHRVGKWVYHGDATNMINMGV